MPKDKDPDSPCEFDEVFKHASSFGKYQKILFFCSCLVVIQVTFPYGIHVFAMGTPNYHCTTTNLTCPPNQCCNNCTSYVFDGPFNSIVQEWNLLCDRAPLKAAIQSCFYTGDIFGSFTFGIFSDAYGRRKCIFLSSAMLVTLMFSASFVDCLSFLGFLWFCAGFSVSGIIVSQYVFIMELVGPKARTFVGNAYEFYWAFGGITITLLAMLIRETGEWRLLILVASLPCLLLLPFWRVFPETPRWLVAHGRLDEAHVVLMKYGGKDNKPQDPETLRDVIENVRRSQINREGKDKKYTPLDLLRTPKIRKWTLTVCSNRFCVACVSHGMLLFTANLAGNVYLNYAIMHIIPLAFQPVYWLIIKRFGRRVPHGAAMLVVTLLCFAIIAVPEAYPMARRTLFIAAFAVNWCLWTTSGLFASEIFPTVLRNKANGVTGTMGRLGSVTAPFIAMLGSLPGIGMTIPVIIFGVVSLIGCIITYWIPETIYANLHQTIEEAEAAEEDFGIPCCRKPPPGEPIEIKLEAGEQQEPFIKDKDKSS